VRYVYFITWDSKTRKKKQVYCGPESLPESFEKAKQLEREYLKGHIREFKLKLTDLDTDKQLSGEQKDLFAKENEESNGTSTKLIRSEKIQLELEEKYLAGERLELERHYLPKIKEDFSLARHVSYIGNREVPLLRLFRYKEAFSVDFARRTIRDFNLDASDYIIDPFSGMGSTLFASMLEGIKSIGIDRLPVAVFISQTIPKFLEVESGSLISTFKVLSSKVDNAELATIAEDVSIIKDAFQPKILTRLKKWKSVIETLENPYRDIFRLLLLSILEDTSFTSKDGQFLRLLPDKPIADPDEALEEKVANAEEDIGKIKWFFSTLNNHQQYFPKSLEGDTRDLSKIQFDSPPSALITSPPYLNRYDYSRSYCLELCFYAVKNFQELKEVRRGILRSHIESKLLTKDEKPKQNVVKEIVEALQKKELNNPNIPDMIIGYFNDMEDAIKQWSSVLAPNARVAMVVDNVRFEGELIPVDLILSEIAVQNGFEPDKILITRYKGNSSQQMGKYGRIAVRESVVHWRKL
jgi:tRNA G10  N-methylase Trm11